MTGDGIEYQPNGIPSAYSDSSSMADSSDAEQPKVNDLCWGEYRDFYNVRFTENQMDLFQILRMMLLKAVFSTLLILRR